MKKQLAVYVVAVSVITRKRRFDKAPFTGTATLMMDLTPELEGISITTGTSLKFAGMDFRIVSFREGCATGEQLVAKFCDTDRGVEFEFYLDIPTSSSSRDSLRGDDAVRDLFLRQYGWKALDDPHGGSLTTPWQLADANK